MFFKALYHTRKRDFQFYDRGFWKISFLMVPAFYDQVVAKLVVEPDTEKTNLGISLERNLYWTILHRRLRGISMMLLTHVCLKCCCWRFVPCWEIYQSISGCPLLTTDRIWKKQSSSTSWLQRKGDVSVESFSLLRRSVRGCTYCMACATSDPWPPFSDLFVPSVAFDSFWLQKSI